MRATYTGFEAKKQSNFIQPPPPGVYVGQIQGVRLEQSYDKSRDEIVLMLEITEGEYANHYHKMFDEQKSSFGDGVKYKGTLKLRPFIDGDEAWVRNRFEGNLWCVEQSNPGYSWDWDENKLKGKKVGFSIRKSLYTGNDGKDKETTEIAKLESIEDVREGKCKVMKERDGRKKGSGSAPSEAQGQQQGYEDVSGTVEVPF